MAVAPSPARPLSSRLLDPTQEYRLETQALRLIETLFRPGDVVCLAWKVRGGSGVTRMHHDYRAFEQIVAQHRAGRGILRHLSSLNHPPPPVKESDRALFERRHRSDVYFCVNPLRPLRGPGSGEMVYRRRRAHVAAVRTVGMDMDDGGPAGLERLREDVVEGLLPAPHLIVQTSHGDLGSGPGRRYHQRCHLLWAAADAGDDPAGFTVQAAEELIQRLAPRYGAAPDVRSGEHLLRVPRLLQLQGSVRRPVVHRHRRSGFSGSRGPHSRPFRDRSLRARRARLPCRLRPRPRAPVRAPRASSPSAEGVAAGSPPALADASRRSAWCCRVGCRQDSEAQAQGSGGPRRGRARALRRPLCPRDPLVRTLLRRNGARLRGSRRRRCRPATRSAIRSPSRASAARTFGAGADQLGVQVPERLGEPLLGGPQPLDLAHRVLEHGSAVSAGRRTRRAGSPAASVTWR